MVKQIESLNNSNAAYYLELAFKTITLSEVCKLFCVDIYGIRFCVRYNTIILFHEVNNENDGRI